MERKKISCAEYRESIFDICSFLLGEMEYFLKEEGRCFKTVNSYLKRLKKAYSSFEVNHDSPEKLDTYGRVLSILRPQIYKDYSRLRKRKLSPADCVISITHGLLDNLDHLGNVDMEGIEIGRAHV